jgi:hypothetical protein
MLSWFLTFALAASLPAITVPSGQFIAPGSAVTISGISIAESGAGPTVQFTTTVAASGILTATGAVVTGSGTSSLTIAGTSAQTNTALATLAVNETCAVPAQCTDAITVNTHDASNNTAPQQQIPIVADGNKYLTFSTFAAAVARTNQQAVALNNSGVTQCWWPVVPLSGSTGSGDTCTGSWTGPAAVQIQNGNPCFDVTVGPNATSPCAIARLHAGTGLTSGEQSSLVTAPNAGFAAPTISGGVVVP